MHKPVNGTWFEFCHHTESEGKYWNEECRHFTSEQWEEKVDEIASLGMKYIVLMNTAIVNGSKGESFFETDIFPFAGIECRDPIEALLSAADRNGIKVFISCGFYGNRNLPGHNISSSAVTQRSFRAMKQLYEKYGKHKSFYGWYLPDETCIVINFSSKFIKYVNRYCEKANEIAPGTKVLIAPFGTNLAVPGARFIHQLKSIKADYIAYQDEVGVKKATPKHTGKIFKKLKRAHDIAGGPKIWADIEFFTFEGPVYRSALIPAGIERITEQLNAVSPYVDEILCYQYQGLMNMPGTGSFCGHEKSFELYNEIKKYNMNRD